MLQMSEAKDVQPTLKNFHHGGCFFIDKVFVFVQ